MSPMEADALVLLQRTARELAISTSAGIGRADVAVPALPMAVLSPRGQSLASRAEGPARRLGPGDVAGAAVYAKRTGVPVVRTLVPAPIRGPPWVWSA